MLLVEAWRRAPPAFVPQRRIRTLAQGWRLFKVPDGDGGESCVKREKEGLSHHQGHSFQGRLLILSTLLYIERSFNLKDPSGTSLMVPGTRTR